MRGLYKKAAVASRSTQHFSQSSWRWRKCIFPKHRYEITILFVKIQRDNFSGNDKQRGLHNVGFIADCFKRISDNTLIWNKLFKALHKNRFIPKILHNRPSWFHCTKVCCLFPRSAGYNGAYPQEILCLSGCKVEILLFIVKYGI